MAVVPEFSAQGAPNEVASVIAQASGAASAARESGQNLMLRAAANRRAEEAAQMEKINFEIEKPVRQAAAAAQIAEHTSGLAVTKQMNDFVASSLNQFPQIVQDWNDTAQIEEPTERINARREVLGRVSAFSGLKQIAPVVKAWQEQYASDALDQRTAEGLAGKTEIAGAKNETEITKKTLDLQAREAALKMQQDRFEQQQAHAKELEALKAQHAQELQAVKGEQQAANIAAQGKNKIASGRELTVGKANDAVVQEVPQAQAEIRDYTKALEILNDPTVRTGTGAEFETAVKRIGGIFGADMTGVKNVEQLQALLGTSFLEKAKSLKGNFSDRDASNMAKIVPSVGKTNEGNIALLNMIIQKRQRDVAIADMIQQGRRGGDSEREIQMDVYDYIRDNPLGVTAPSAAAATAGGGLSPDEQKRLQELRAKLGK